MADISILTSSVRDLITAVNLLITVRNGDKETINALNAQIKALSDAAAAEQPAIDALNTDVIAAKNDAAAASELGGSMGGAV